MKKIFVALMAVAAIALVGCEKEKEVAQNTNPNPDNGNNNNTELIPEGYVDILIQVPDGEECHGIYMKGCVNGQWSGADTYVGEESGATEADKAIRFVRIAENSEFFKARFKLGTDGLEGAVCQKYPDDGSWQGKSRKVSLIAEKTTLEGADQLELPQFHIPAGAKPGVLALKIGGWENSECVEANQAGKATWVLKTTATLPEGTEVGITGVNLEGYANWEHANPIIMQKQDDGSYVAINNVGASCVYKYVLRLPGEPVFADHHGHIIDGSLENLVMPVSLEPVDEVEDWLELDKIYGAEDFNPENNVYGLIGNALNGWGDNDDVQFVYKGENEGVYTYEATNVTMKADAFKVRLDNKWDVNYGWSDIKITGDEDNFEDAQADNNILVKQETVYSSVQLTFKWNGAQRTEITLNFTK